MYFIDTFTPVDFLELLARWQYGVYVVGGLLNVREMK